MKFLLLVLSVFSYTVSANEFPFRDGEYNFSFGEQVASVPSNVDDSSYLRNLQESEAEFIRKSVAAYAIKSELLDVREARYFLSTNTEIVSDINIIRRRRVELQNAPHIVDVEPFPDRVYINSRVAFNRAFHRHIAERGLLEPDRKDFLTEIASENQKLYTIWDAARDAKCDFYYITVRRQALVKLKYLIGEEDFNQGKLPDNVPTWRFNQLGE